jgi:hypothetical protein
VRRKGRSASTWRQTLHVVRSSSYGMPERRPTKTVVTRACRCGSRSVLRVVNILLSM